MIKFNGKEYRNLEEQVLANMEAIEEIHDIGLLLAQLGIKVVGQVDTAEELPDPTEYYADDRENHYGDAYAVGATTPYYFYIFTRPFEGETDPKWFSIGQFPMTGPQGEQGEPGESADFDSASFVSSGFNEPNITGTLNLVSGSNTKSIPMAVTRPLKPGIGITLSTDAAGVTAPSIELFNHHITMDENRYDEFEELHEGWHVEFDVISTRSEEIESFSELCELWYSHQGVYADPFLPATGIKYDSPYPQARYSNTFATSVHITARNKTAVFFGIKIDPGNYDQVVQEAGDSKDATACSAMAWADHVTKIPNIIQTEPTT